MPPTRKRGRHLRRVVKAAALAGGRRLMRKSDDDDRAFGEALLAELDTMKGMAMKVGQILSYMAPCLPRPRPGSPPSSAARSPWTST